MKPAKLTGSAAASMLAVAPLAFAEDAQSSPTPNTPRLATIQAAEEKPTDALNGDQPAEDETPEPIEVVPVPTTSPTEVPQPTEEPSEQPSESAEPAPEPTANETAPADSTAEPTADATIEPSAEPSESDNAPVPVETIAPTPSATAEALAPEINEPEVTAEAVPVEVDAEQNILLTGTVTQEQTTETGETVVVTEEITAAGEQVTTEFVVNLAEGQTTVTQTVTNPATGEKKTTERKVPSTTFKAGGAASIEAAPAADRMSAAAPLLLGVVGATGVSLAVAGIILYRRQATTAS